MKSKVLVNGLTKWGVKSLLCLIVGLITSVIAKSQNLSNRGTEFWVGYGHHQFMETGTNTQNMVLYLSTDAQPATVTVEIFGSGNPLIPSTQWRRTYNIPAFTVISTEVTSANTFTAAAGAVGPMPKSGSYDCRLFSDPPPAGTGGAGIFNNRAIRITSANSVPIVAYAHIYGSTSSGATMLLPVETWGYSYISLNSKQSYASDCYSWTYIIAKENNTKVEITPSVLTRAQNITGLAPGVPTVITLQKGQIYQIIGANDGADANGNGGSSSTGRELTGTKIRSIPSGDGVCRSIAVFAGSSRTSNPASCGSGGGDNDNQQLFPQHTWGKEYVTTPFSGSSTLPAFATCTYKIAVSDPTTVVRRNGVQITGLQNGNYYQFESSTPDRITADKPISVAQFMTGGNCIPGPLGDPAMVVLSPLEQGIKRAVFYRNCMESITEGYLSLVVRTNALSSLKIDNSNSFAYVAPHPNKPGYSIVVQKWTGTGGSNGGGPASCTNKGQSIVTCDSTFTAITYGLGSFESYAYNAGTNLDPLIATAAVHNAKDTTANNFIHNVVYANQAFILGAYFQYKPTKIVWTLAPLAGNLSPAQNITQNNPIPTDSVFSNGAWLYLYQLPGTYTFNTPGEYSIRVASDSPVPQSGTDCILTDISYIKIIVLQTPTVNTFTYTQPAACSITPVTFTAPLVTVQNYSIVYYKWTFTNNPGDTARGRIVSFLFPTTGTYPVKLEILTDQGGYATITINVTVTSGGQPSSTFTANKTNICVGEQVTFTPTSNVAGTTGWWWDFAGASPNVTATNNSPQTITFNTAGTYIVKHTILGSGAGFPCPADTIPVTINVAVTPSISSATPISPTNCNGNDGKIELSGLANNTAYTISYSYNGGPAVNVNLTSNANGVVTIPNLQIGTYTNIKATIGSCASNTIASVSIVNPSAPATPTAGSNSPICQNGTINLSANTTTSGAISYNWSGPNGFSSTDQNPTITNAGTNASGTYSVTATLNGCTSNAGTVTVTVNANPVIGLITTTNPTTCATNTGTITLNGLTANTAYAVSYNVGSNPVTPVNITSNAGGQLVIPNLAAGSYSNFVVSVGNCSSAPVAGPFVLNDPSAPPAPTVNPVAAICEGATLNLNANSNTPGVNYNWTGPNGFTSTLQNPSIATATVAASGNYAVSVTLNGCTSAATAVNALVKPIPAPPTVNNNGPLCAGSTLNLTAVSTTPGVTYNWTGPNSFTNNNQNPTINNVTVAATGSYAATATLDGCTSTANATQVVINAVPVINIATGSNPTTCATTSGSIQLGTLLNNTSYTVKYVLAGNTVTANLTSNASGIITIPNLGAGVYSNITVTLNNCESAPKGPITLSDPNPPATPVAASNTPVCTGTTLNLTATSSTAGVTYEWTGPNNFSSNVQNPSITNVSSAAAGTYSVKAILNGCQSSNATTVVVVNQTPAVTNTVTNNPTSCATNTGSLVLEGLQPSVAYTVSYTKNSGSPVTVNLTSNASGNVTIPNLGAGIYANITLTRTGCTSAPVGPFTLSDPNPPATPTISGVTNLCNGNTLSLTANTVTAGVTYNWTGPNGFTSSGAVVNRPNAQANMSGNYTVVATLGACVSQPASVTATINTTPNISNATLTNPVNCNSATGSIRLNGLQANTAFMVIYTNPTGTADTVQLTSNAAGQVIIGGLAAGAYSNVRVVLGICTSNALSQLVLSDPAPPATPTFTGLNSVCEGTNVIIVANSSTTGVSYTWSGPNGFTAVGQNLTLNNTTLNMSGNYVVTVTKNNCSTTASRSISINPNPVAAFTMPSFVCMPGGSVKFTNSSTISSGTMTYFWNLGDGSTSTATSPSKVYASSGSYNIKLVATSNKGCTDSVTKTFNQFFNKPTAAFSVNRDTLCQGIENIFTDNSTAPNSSITNRRWNFGDNNSWTNTTATTRNKTYANAGTFVAKLIVTNTQGCVSDTAKKTVVVYVQPKVDAGPSFLVPEGTLVTFKPSVNDSTNVNFLWSPPTGLNRVDTLRPSLTATDDRQYILTATGKVGGCQAKDTLTVKVLKKIKVPNAFSPNGDGVNDRWEIENLEAYVFATVRVFNRYGQIVYESRGYGVSWDGTYKGKPIPVGVYYYIIDFKNPNYFFPQLSGSVTIIR